MKYLISVPLFLFILWSSSSCTNDMKEVDNLMEGVSEDKEIAKNVEILYSDSAVVRVRIKAPTLIRYISRTIPKEEFPDGIFVEFLNENKATTSWLKADYAIRDINKKQIILRENVEMKNRKKERILSSELIWDESKEYLFTQKYVKIIQPATQDTTEGFGFETNQEFTKFEIKRMGSASLNATKLKSELERQK